MGYMIPSGAKVRTTIKSKNQLNDLLYTLQALDLSVLQNYKVYWASYITHTNKYVEVPMQEFGDFIMRHTPHEPESDIY